MIDQNKSQSPLQYLLILNAQNQPLLFKIYKSGYDDLNIQLHCYACIDFLQSKIIQKQAQYLGQVYTIYTLTGQYSIFVYHTVTKIKIFGIFRNKGDNNKKLNQIYIKDFFMKVYRIYKLQLYQPFIGIIKQNRFSKKFHYHLDKLADDTIFS